MWQTLMHITSEKQLQQVFFVRSIATEALKPSADAVEMGLAIASLSTSALLGRIGQSSVLKWWSMFPKSLVMILFSTEPPCGSVTEAKSQFVALKAGPQSCSTSANGGCVPQNK